MMLRGGPGARAGAGAGTAAVVALLAFPLAGAAQQARDIGARELEAFDAYVADAVRDWNVPGLAIALVHGDSLIFAEGYGVREVGRPDPVTPDTRFAIGSTTKAMTTAALAMLVDEGKLSWDDRVIDHLPELRLHDAYVTRELTVRDLLTHRSGLPGTDAFWSTLEYPMSLTMERLRFIEPSASFRAQWQYQNVVYAIAGVLVERLSGMSWDAFVRQRIFAPLDMNDTEPLDADILQKPNVAVPHRASGDSLHTTPQRSVDMVASVGSVWSSVADMSKWMRFMLDSARIDGRPLIAPATFNEIVTPEIRAPHLYDALALAKPHIFTYALGWFVQDYEGDVVWMHTGSINGMSAIVGLLPDHRFGIVALVNRDHAELRHALMYRAFDLAAGRSGRDWSTDLREHLAAQQQRVASASAAPAPAPPSLPLERYTGTYRSDAYGDVHVTLSGGSLQLAIGDDAPRTLAHRTYEVFGTVAASGGFGSSVTFVPDGAGRIASLRLFGASFDRRAQTADR